MKYIQPDLTHSTKNITFNQKFTFNKKFHKPKISHLTKIVPKILYLTQNTSVNQKSQI
jgi:hypothetical protein